MAKTAMRRLMDSVTRRHTIESTFVASQQQALEAYRKAVASHLDGKAVDLPLLLQLGPQIGIPASKVGQVFASDVEILEKHREQAKHVAVLEKIAKESEKAGRGAAEDVQRLTEALEDAIRRRDAFGFDAQAKAYASGDLHRLEQSNARLWGTLVEVEAQSEELVTDAEEVVQKLETVPSGIPDTDDAVWIEDD